MKVHDQIGERLVIARGQFGQAASQVLDFLLLVGHVRVEFVDEHDNVVGDERRFGLFEELLYDATRETRVGVELV